jgi:aryl-alcohol dehydrogenase (NADP+)
MEYVNLGCSGLKVSRICLGTLTFGDKSWRDWMLSEDESRPIIRRALELGINFFDTADMYSQGVSEEILGRALCDFARREEMVIATKVFFPMGDKPNDRGLSRKHIMRSIDASLRRLGTDHVDLYQIHHWDDETPIEETMSALHDVIATGKVRYIGASNLLAWQLAKAQYTSDLHGWTRLTAIQNHYNLVYREDEREVLPFCRDQQIGTMPWSPLARGFLARKPQKGGNGTARAASDELLHERYARESDYVIASRVASVAEQRGVTPAQIALAWLLNTAGITSPIVGVSKIRHLEEAAASVSIALDQEEMAFLEEPYQPREMIKIV